MCNRRLTAKQQHKAGQSEANTHQISMKTSFCIVILTFCFISSASPSFCLMLHADRFMHCRLLFTFDIFHHRTKAHCLKLPITNRLCRSQNISFTVICIHNPRVIGWPRNNQQPPPPPEKHLGGSLLEFKRPGVHTRNVIGPLICNQGVVCFPPLTVRLFLNHRHQETSKQDKQSRPVSLWRGVLRLLVGARHPAMQIETPEDQKHPHILSLLSLLFFSPPLCLNERRIFAS